MENTVENMMDQQNQGINYSSGDDGFEDNVVTMTENGDFVPVTETGVQGASDPDTGTPSGDAAQTTSKGFQNQQQINRAIAKRLQADRQKYQPDIEFSNKLRGLFGNMSDDDILSKVQAIAANDYAATKNIPVPVAEEVLNLRMQNRQPIRQEPTPNEDILPNNINALAMEARAIESKYGEAVAQELLQKIAADTSIQQRVFGEGVSLNDILIEHLQAQQPRKKVYSPAASPNGAGNIHTPMTDEEYKRIKEQLHQGKKVRR